MYKKGDLTVSLEEAQESANFANIPVEEWAEQYGWTLEGKTTATDSFTSPGRLSMYFCPLLILLLNISSSLYALI